MLGVMLQPPHYVSTQACAGDNGLVLQRAYVDTDSQLKRQDPLPQQNGTNNGCPWYHLGINTDTPQCHLDVHSNACVRGEIAISGPLKLHSCQFVDLCETLTRFDTEINYLKQRLPP